MNGLSMEGQRRMREMDILSDISREIKEKFESSLSKELYYAITQAVHKGFNYGKQSGKIDSKNLYVGILHKLSELSKDMNKPISDPKVLDKYLEKCQAEMEVLEAIDILRVDLKNESKEQYDFETELALHMAGLSDDIANAIRELKMIAKKLNLPINSPKVLETQGRLITPRNFHGTPMGKYNIFITNVLSALFYSDDNADYGEKMEEILGWIRENEGTTVMECLNMLKQFPMSELEVGQSFYIIPNFRSERWTVTKIENGEIYADSYYCSETKINPKIEKVWRYIHS